MSEQEMVEAGRATGSTTEQDVTMNADAPKRALSSEDEAKLAELDQAIEKFRSQKRWSDVIRRTLAKVDIVIDVQQKVDLLVEAGELFIERSSNQAEAIKCFEKVLGFDPENEGAIQRLKEMYEKRRDWERWLQVMQREVALLDPSEQAGRYLEIAHLANERVRKPQTRIDVWECVLRQDPQHPEAVENLVKLYEQVRNYEALAAVLETHIDMVDNTQQKKQLLQKLGSIYADRLDRGEESVSAFQRLLALDPSDRRAQEQLKRRYLALRQWEELEEFYAVSGKWDELIRVLEREAEGTSLDEHDKVGVLLKVAALWEDKKERPDRAIKAYERIREVEPNNVQAAQALIPIYQKAEEYPKLAEVLEVRIGALDSNVDVTERTQLLTTTARV
ncbi:MAG: tetratricopeptide repeat protein, partial [Polyangiales bacterium]